MITSTPRNVGDERLNLRDSGPPNCIVAWHHDERGVRGAHLEALRQLEPGTRLTIEYDDEDAVQHARPEDYDSDGRLDSVVPDERPGWTSGAALKRALEARGGAVGFVLGTSRVSTRRVRGVDATTPRRRRDGSATA